MTRLWAILLRITGLSNRGDMTAERMAAAERVRAFLDSKAEQSVRFPILSIPANRVAVVRQYDHAEQKFSFVELLVEDIELLLGEAENGNGGRT